MSKPYIKHKSSTPYGKTIGKERKEYFVQKASRKKVIDDGYKSKLKEFFGLTVDVKGKVTGGDRVCNNVMLAEATVYGNDIHHLWVSLDEESMSKIMGIAKGKTVEVTVRGAVSEYRSVKERAEWVKYGLKDPKVVKIS
mgnify:CR=1 FL=1